MKVFVCEVGGWEWSKVLKVTKDKKVAISWLRSKSQIIHKLNKMKDEWKQSTNKDKMRNEVIQETIDYAEKHGLNFDTSHAHYTEMLLE